MVKTMKKILIFFVAMMFVLSMRHTKCDERNIFAFEDVSKDDWYYDAVTELLKNDVIPVNSTFNGDELATRGEIVQFFYNLNRHTNGNTVLHSEHNFDDVPKSSPYYRAIVWAADNELINGHDDGLFYPDDICEREQICAVAIRYFDVNGVKAKANYDTEQFADSLEISDFARSYVAAARLCGIVIGDENQFFNPHEAITKAEAASVVQRVMNIQALPPEEENFVKTDSEAYKYLYDDYRTVSQYLFEPYTLESEPEELPYFDDAVFIGDSVTMSLQFFAASSGTLGNAKFLCAGSLSPANALRPVSETSLHPSVDGVKMMLDDAVRAIGAKKVYVMLGINSMYLGVDKTFEDFVVIMDSIVAKSPDAKILIQSTTPMTSDSPIRTDRVNNEEIVRYNKMLLDLCKDRGWYYLDVAEVMKDSSGALKQEYCCDPEKMGIHLSTEANKIWAKYIKTHVPEELK